MGHFLFKSIEAITKSLFHREKQLISPHRLVSTGLQIYKALSRSLDIDGSFSIIIYLNSMIVSRSGTEYLRPPLLAAEALREREMVWARLPKDHLPVHHLVPLCARLQQPVQRHEEQGGAASSGEVL